VGICVPGGDDDGVLSGPGLISGQANFNGQVEYDAASGDIPNPDGIYLGTTTPGGTYAPNGWGLYDMIGNLWELCQDFYGPYPIGRVTDPQGTVSGYVHVFRGGSWGRFADGCRSARRSPSSLNPASKWDKTVGFRVVLASSQP
jgi:formylglycine-generating enzyme required for sulfatase activity